MVTRRQFLTGLSATYVVSGLSTTASAENALPVNRKLDGTVHSW